MPQSIQHERGDKTQAAGTQWAWPPSLTFFLPSRRLSLTNQQHNAPTPDPTNETKNNKTRRQAKRRTKRQDKNDKKNAASQTASGAAGKPTEETPADISKV